MQVGRQSHAPAAFTPPGKTRYKLYRRLGGPQGRSGRAENIAPTGIRSPDRPVRSESLYQLSYRAPRFLRRTESDAVMCNGLATIYFIRESPAAPGLRLEPKIESKDESESTDPDTRALKNTNQFMPRAKHYKTLTVPLD